MLLLMRNAPLIATPLPPRKVPRFMLAANFSLGNSVGTPAIAKAIATPV
jgi:hypothetical protein